MGDVQGLIVDIAALQLIPFTLIKVVLDNEAAELLFPGVRRCLSLKLFFFPIHS
jgi:hypothetical protein